MKTRYVLLIILLVVLYVSNPSIKDHHSAVNVKISTLLKSEIGATDNAEKSLGAEIGMLFGSSLIYGIVQDVIHREDYFLFSLTRFEFKGETTIIGLGILGKVYISDEVDKQFKKAKESLSNLFGMNYSTTSAETNKANF